MYLVFIYILFALRNKKIICAILRSGRKEQFPSTLLSEHFLTNKRDRFRSILVQDIHSASSERTKNTQKPTLPFIF